MTLQYVTPDPLNVIAEAARTSRRSVADSALSNEQLVRNLRTWGHDVPLEFARARFHIRTGRSTANQLVRYRAMSVVQESTRYCNYADNKFGEVQCIAPLGIDKYVGAMDELLQTYQQAEGTYLRLIASGVPPEIARAALPLELATNLVVEGSFRHWLHFLAQRGSPHAQADIRALAADIGKALWDSCPAVFESELQHEHS